MTYANQLSSERTHIGFFGERNAGKSSVVNAVTGQDLAVVSDQKGTTTDPVKKAMEILPLGPVVIVDTPGIDDEGELGALRVRKAREMVRIVDIAVVVVDAKEGMTEATRRLIHDFTEKKTPTLVVYNKVEDWDPIPDNTDDTLYVSAEQGIGIEALKERLARIIKEEEREKKIVADLLKRGDACMLIVPIDDSAPKGRLILPQQQVIRELLEHGMTTLVVRETEIAQGLDSLRRPPQLVITDSQVFGIADKAVPKKIHLTSFSILFARYKGNLAQYVAGAAQLDRLQDGDTVLISEGCTHHRQCEDIGTVKIPRWVSEYTGKKLNFHFTAGTEFPEDGKEAALIIHCGACMLTERAMQDRLERAKALGIPITNYGIAIAKMREILARSLACFEDTLD